MNNFRVFSEPDMGSDIGAQVFVDGKEGEYLPVSDTGVIQIPEGVNPTGFYLTLHVAREGRIAVSQKDIGQKEGGYNRESLSQLPGLNQETVKHVMHNPIAVMKDKVTGTVYTVWHDEKTKRTNRVDIAYLNEDGRFCLYQVGVIFRDHGPLLYGETRYKGRLYKDFVVKPAEPKWGRFQDTWKPIFGEPGFQKLIDSAQLQTWSGSREELDPPLPPVSDPGQSRVDWFVSFAGHRGQGIGILHPSDGKNVWIHGEQVREEPGSDGVLRLWRGELVSFTGKPQKWGNKAGAPPRILNVKKVS